MGDKQAGDRRVLVLSQRNVVRILANSMLYEFEDLIVEWENADLTEVASYHSDRRFTMRRSAFQGLRSVGASPGLAMKLVPSGRSMLPPDEPYDVVVLVTSTAFDLFTLQQLQTIRRQAKKVVVYVAETWPAQASSRALRLEPWDLVDHIFVGLPTAANSLSRILGRDVHAVPLGVDTDVFAPEPRSPAKQSRPVAVCNPGRRSTDQHQLIRQFCEERGEWYWFDTSLGGTFVSTADHRRQYAQLLKRSATVICNAAKFDDNSRVGNARVVPGRVLEAMAAGCRIVGQPLPDLAFADVGLPVMDFEPFSLSPTADETRKVLEAGWSETARARYVGEAQRSLDWSHRWAAILETLGLQPSASLQRRRERLGAGALIDLADDSDRVGS